MNPTLIEQVMPVPAPSGLVRLDAWRWQGVLGFDAYRARVLEQEVLRASQRAVEAYTAELVTPSLRVVA